MNHRFLLSEDGYYTTRPTFSRSDYDTVYTPISEERSIAKVNEINLIRFPYGLYFQTDDKPILELTQKYKLNPEYPYSNIRSVALLIEEDIAIISNNRLSSACVCFPSSWDPLSKRNKTFAEIHVEVANNEHLINASERITEIMCKTDKIFERYVWTLTYSSRLSQHIQYKKEPQSTDKLYFRYEHQRFTSITKVESSVFTIAPYVVEFDEYFDTEDKRRILRKTLDNMDVKLIEYKNLREIKNRLCTEN